MPVPLFCRPVVDFKPLMPAHPLPLLERRSDDIAGLAFRTQIDRENRNGNVTDMINEVWKVSIVTALVLWEEFLDVLKFERKLGVSSVLLELLCFQLVENIL